LNGRTQDVFQGHALISSHAALRRRAVWEIPSLLGD
jgi:hypothetical protein